MQKDAKSLKTRLLLFSLAIALTPLAMLAWRTTVNMGHMRQDLVNTFGEYAIDLIDVVERNLFERYGDVQVFAANETTLDRSQWGVRNETENGIVRAMNKYMDLYGIYTIMIAVDLDGKPIAVNSRDADGNPVDNDWAYEMDFSSAPWFRDVLAGRFLKGPNVDGTVVEDVHLDPLVKRVDKSEGLGIAFSAPILDSSGKPIGVWTNRISFELVDRIFEDSYRNLKTAGYATSELTLLDKEGRIIVDLDPTFNNDLVEANDDMSVLLKLNLATSGVKAAKEAVDGKHGANISLHKRKQINQVAGYAHSKGALGYPGLGWSALVRIDEKEAMSSFLRESREMLIITIASIILVVFAAWRMASHLIGPIKKISDSIMDNVDRSRQASGIVDQNARSLADGATEQAANVEETSASCEELNAMAAQTSGNISKALAQVKKASDVVHDTNHQVESLKTAMQEISSASDETKNIIKTIDEIAFQTNILALNAAVEAARAGEAGAGFAVVADEVRNLAARAAEAARNTSQLIDLNISKISQGAKSVQETDEGFQTILDATNEIANIMQEIDEAASQQTSGLGEINRAVTQISSVTQENAAGAEEVASASRELKTQADSISDLAGQLDSIVTGKTHPTKSPASNYTPAAADFAGESRVDSDSFAFN